MPNESPTKRSPKRLQVQFIRWSRSVRLGNKLAIALAVLALISGTATFAAMTRTEAPFDPGGTTLQILLMVDVIIFLALAGIIARRLVIVWLEHRRGAAGSKLHARIVGFFSLVAVGPPILMAFFAALFLDLGIESWFSNKVRTTLENSLVVAESYIEEHRRVIQADILAMAADLNRQALRVEQNTSLLNLMVEDQAAKRALSEAIVFRGDGTLLARSTLNVNLSPEIGIPKLALQQMKSCELVTISEHDDDRVRALIRLENFFDGYLYVSRFVDTKVLGHVNAAKAAVADYQAIEGDRDAIQMRFNIVFLVVGLLVLMAAIWIGLSIATQMVAPISKLVDASGKVARGDLTARVPNLSTSDEIGVLSRAFNRMTSELASQQKALIQTNQKLDDRRRFTEAVLSGVSAGVVGLDQNGRVTLPNATAIDMLGGEIQQIEGRDIVDILPEALPLFEEARSTAKESVSSQISVLRRGNSRILSVRIAPERGDGRRSGFVMTFDDITDQLGDQRTAAWADVARRIAHEIKNPLTPIQLSAERLQRKYQNEIVS
ncbi:MAG: HAMP domain-containing protein, partial [Sphingomonadales bacterium]|nr:HAMP domain-containing protein [Sphingomonadales bacterium]